MYQITLSRSERQAIDWIDNRYWHGQCLYNLLTDVVWEGEWDDDFDITFKLTEPQAWALRDLAEENNYQFDCWADSLVEKWMKFFEGIV